MAADPYYDKFKAPGLTTHDNQALVNDLKKLDLKYRLISDDFKHDRHDALLHPNLWGGL